MNAKIGDSLGVYVVTDADVLTGRDFYECIEEVLRAGVKMIQLREKNCLGKAFLEKALRVRKLTRKHDALFIVNDRVDVAILADADGVHIGQDDLPAGEVRKLLGQDKIVGVSVRTIEEATIAKENDADYIGVGAMFPTATKNDTVNVSMETLVDIATAVDLPIVVIGGINLENIHHFNRKHVQGFAVISAILATEDIYSESRKWLEVTKGNNLFL